MVEFFAFDAATFEPVLRDLLDAGFVGLLVEWDGTTVVQRRFV